MRRFWSIVINFWFVVISAGGMLVLCELLFQRAIFSDWEPAKSLRVPGAYADIYYDKHSPVFSDEYWILYYLFDGPYKPPESPHPLLGWVGKFDGNNFLHRDHRKVQGRIPVLLFGDSFSICVGSDCFEDILNADTTFNKKYYLLNYGVGGYGVDQIYLLARKVIPLYENPLVIFGFMTRDMDRNILKFRTGQKPYFEIADDELVLHAKIESDPAYYAERNKPDITSYIYRYFRNGRENYIPENDPRTVETIEKMKTLNEKILSESLKYLKEREINFRYLVFSALFNGERDWRNLVVREFLEKNHAPYIWSMDLVERDSNYFEAGTDFYEDGNNGHPTTYQNQLICDEIKRILFDSLYATRVDSINTDYFNKIKDQYDESHPYHLEIKIRRDPEWMKSIRSKAEQHGISVDSMVKLDALWLKTIEEKANENKISIDSQIRLEAEFMLKENLNKGTN